MRATRSVVLILLAAFLVSLTSCSGGGGGGIRGVVTRVEVFGLGAPLFTRGQAPSAVCPNGVFLNARISITFDGPVDAMSLPADGPAAGSISITSTSATGSEPATGRFTVDAANPRVVHFDTDQPCDPASPCRAGLRLATLYTLEIAGPGSADVVRVGNGEVSESLLLCFSTLPCDPLAPEAAFADLTPGAPQIIATNPVTGPTAPALDASALAGGAGTTIVTVDVNEALRPDLVDIAHVRLLNRTASPNNPLPVPATVELQQCVAGSGPARIVITTAGQLADGDVYEITLNGLTDVAGNALALAPGDLSFTVNDAMDDQTMTFVETFDSTTNRGDVTGSIEWLGDGEARATLPRDIIGSGLDGMLSFPVSMTINTDNVLTPGDPDAIPGAYNATDLTIGDAATPGVTLTLTGTVDVLPGESNCPARFRATGTIRLHDTVIIEASGRDGASSPNPPQQGTMVELTGGFGGPGGGAGGIGSPVSGDISPAGGTGEGGHIDPADPLATGCERNLDPMNPFFGGGEGGLLGTASNFQEGASGGGGGTASCFGGYPPGQLPPTFSFDPSTDGEPWRGVDGMGGGAPRPGARGPCPPGFVPPLEGATGGSGGGGGGDRFISPANTNPGPGGGGGGGGVSFSAASVITIGNAAELRCGGGNGGEGIGFFIGSAAGGSGGSILVQTFQRIVLGLATTFDTSGGLPNAGTPTTPLDPSNPSTFNGEGGFGGDGVVQLQHDGATDLIADLGASFGVVAGEIFTQPLTLTGNTIQGTATSLPIDTGGSSVAYVMGAATIDPGVTGTIAVMVTGIAEDPANPGQPATTPTSIEGLPLMAGPVDLANLDQLDGYRYFRFEIRTSYPAPPATALGDDLPTADDVSITYIR